jgi:hypothetical protein
MHVTVKASKGLFGFDRLEGGVHGVWIGVPTKNSLTVN